MRKSLRGEKGELFLKNPRKMDKKDP